MKGEFYKMDYEAWDAGTVDLPLELEAAYLRLCHQMYRTGGPIPNSVRLLQGIFRCGHIKAAALLKQLIAAGKIAVIEGDRLINYRVGQELLNRELMSSKRRVSGELGGTNSGVSRAKALKDKAATEALASGQRTRGEEKREEKNPPKAPKGAEAEKFDELRAAYPRRNVSFPTTTARKRWDEAMKRGEDPNEIIAGAKAYAAEQSRVGKVGTEFVKTADVWLNQRRWKDHLGASVDGAPKTDPDAYLATLSDDQWRQAVRYWKKTVGQWDLARYTPAPDSPKTKVPRHILDEVGITPRPIAELFGLHQVAA